MMMMMMMMLLMMMMRTTTTTTSVRFPPQVSSKDLDGCFRDSNGDDATLKTCNTSFHAGPQSIPDQSNSFEVPAEGGLAVSSSSFQEDGLDDKQFLLIYGISGFATMRHRFEFSNAIEV